MTTNSKKRSDIKKTCDNQIAICGLQPRFGMFQIFRFEYKMHTWKVWIRFNKGTAGQNNYWV